MPTPPCSGEARTGSWRDRLPAIFVDLGRLILIVIGIGLLLSWVWGADIGGLITAVGVTSIVIGLAVRARSGPVISGLLLLFEQPFRIGDWLDTKFGRGRVVEVNWRAVHIDTENGLQVVPNAALAGDAFVNLSRTTAPYFKAKATLTFGADGPWRGQSRAAGTRRVAAGQTAWHPRCRRRTGRGELPGIGAHPSPQTRVRPSPSCSTGLGTRRSEGLHLNGAKANRKEHRAFVADHVEQIGASLGLDPESVTAMLAGARLLLFAEGEIVQSVYSVPDSVGFIVEGAVLMFVDTADGAPSHPGRSRGGRPHRRHGADPAADDHRGGSGHRHHDHRGVEGCDERDRAA